MTTPSFFHSFDTKRVAVIRHEGTDSEERTELDAHVQPDTAFFAVDASVYEGDVIEIPDPRGGVTRRVARAVKIWDQGHSSDLHHIEVALATASAPRAAPVRRIDLQMLHADVISAASDLFADGHYSQAVFEACKALEARVREQSGLDLSGRDLMTQAFLGDPAPITLAIERGQSGRDEQEGLRFVFMGLSQGIRNPKGHGLVRQDEPQRALEYLALVSVLYRRLDDARLPEGGR